MAEKKPIKGRLHSNPIKQVTGRSYVPPHSRKKKKGKGGKDKVRGHTKKKRPKKVIKPLTPYEKTLKDYEKNKLFRKVSLDAILEERSIKAGEEKYGKPKPKPKAKKKTPMMVKASFANFLGKQNFFGETIAPGNTTTVNSSFCTLSPLILQI